MVRHCAFDLVGRPGPVGAGYVAPGDLGEHVGLDPSGCDGVAGHAFFSEIGGERFGDAVDRGLAARVQRMVRHSQQPGRDGRRQNESAAWFAVGVCVLTDEELRSHVEAEDEVEAVLGDVLGPVEALRARVGDDDVNLPKVRLGRVKQLRDLGHLGHVRLNGNRFAPRLFNLRDHLLGRRLPLDVVDDDGCLACSELNRNASSDTSTRSGDESDFPAQVGGKRGSVPVGSSIRMSVQASVGGCDVHGVW